MTPEQIEQLRLDADAYAQKEAPFCHPLSMRFAQIRDTEFARLVAADTWERAAKAIRRRNEGRHPIMAAERVEAEKCAKTIEAAAAKEAKPSC